jgi:hypothetical protein
MLAALFIPNRYSYKRDTNGTYQYVVVSALSSDALLQTVKGQLRTERLQDFPLQDKKDILPDAHAGPTAQTSGLRVTPTQPLVRSQASSPEGSRPCGPSDGGDESREPMVSSTVV